MNISVAMATYEGAAYLAEQLGSIAGQGLPPDELVVCDDRSTDQTAAIVRAFAASAPFPVRLEINDRRLGAAENFARAVGRCRGEWIVLADQDDVWLPHKLRTLSEAVRRRPDAALAFSDALLVDPARRPLGGRLWQTLRFGRREQQAVNAGRALDVLLRRNVVTGATMAFRADHRDLLLPIPEGWVQDGWFALLLAAVAGCVAVPEPLVEYRQHPGQQIGARRRSLYEEYLRVRGRGPAEFEAVAASYAAARDRLLAFRDRLRDCRALERLERKIEHFRAKARMRAHRALRLPLVTRELACGRYARYSTGWRSLAQDLFT